MRIYDTFPNPLEFEGIREKELRPRSCQAASPIFLRIVTLCSVQTG